MSTSTTRSTTAATSVADDVWAAKREKLRKRGRKERPFEFLDESLESELAAALEVVGAAELSCRRAVEREHAESTRAVREKAVADALKKNRTVTNARRKATLARKARDEGTVTILLRGLGSDVYEELVAAHPPAEDDKNAGRDYAIATFAPALIAACSVDEMEEADAAELLADLSQGEASLLFATAVEVNQSAHVSLGKG